MLNVGFVTTVSGRWPRELPAQRLKAYAEGQQKTWPDVRWVVYDALAGDAGAIREAGAQFKAAGVDVVVLLYGAFSGDDAACAITEATGAPIILWAPHELPYSPEDRLYANALVAMTMNAAALHRLDHPCHALYGDLGEAEVMESLGALLNAYGAKKTLRGAQFGLFGYRPTAFYNSTFDEALIRRTFGLTMEETDLAVVFDRMAAQPEAQVQAEMARVLERWPVELPEGHLENHARLYLTLKELMRDMHYQYAAIKCWPEMGPHRACPCAVIGRLMDEGYPIACEGDVDAGLAMAAERALTGDAPVFVTDMIDLDTQANALRFWHCGNPAPSLMNPDSTPCLRNHPLANQGTAFWCGLKGGPVTIARFYNDHGRYKLFLMHGQARPTPRYTRGAMVDVVVERPVRDVVQGIVQNGIPHHYALVWHDVAQAMRTLCELLHIPVVEL